MLPVLCAGHARSLLTPDSNVLVQPGVAGHIAHAGVTGAHAAAAAADNLALIMDDSNLWDGMLGGPKCSVSCNGEVGSPSSVAALQNGTCEKCNIGLMHACMHARDAGHVMRLPCWLQNVTAMDDNGKGVYSCWGLFKAFCKGKGEYDGTFVAGAAGFKCKGHFVGVKVGHSCVPFACAVHCAERASPPAASLQQSGLRKSLGRACLLRFPRTY